LDAKRLPTLLLKARTQTRWRLIYRVGPVLGESSPTRKLAWHLGLQARRQISSCVTACRGPETLVLYRMRPILEVRGWALCWERVRYSGLKEAAFVRGGRYGISIDFGLEVIGRKSSCGATVNVELISFPMMPRLPMASSYRETHHSSRPTSTLLLVSDLPCRWLRARAGVRRKAASFKPASGK